MALKPIMPMHVIHLPRYPAVLFAIFSPCLLSGITGIIKIDGLRQQNAMLAWCSVVAILAISIDGI